MMREGKKITTPEQLVKLVPSEAKIWNGNTAKIPKPKAINRDTVVIPSALTLDEIMKVLESNGYKYNAKSSTWKSGKSVIGINWNDSGGRGSAVLWQESNTMNEKVDIKKLKGPFPFRAKSGKDIDIYLDDNRDKKQWYIPQLDKFVDEKEAQKWLKSEDSGELEESTLRIAPKFSSKKGVIPVIDTGTEKKGTPGDIVGEITRGGKGFSFEFEDELQDKLKPSEKEFSHRNMQSVISHMNKLFSKLSPKKESTNNQEDNDMLDEKDNKSTLKTHDLGKTDDDKDNELQKNVNSLFSLLKKGGHSKAPTSFNGLAVPPDMQKILNQKFSGKGSLAEDTEDVELDEGIDPKAHGAGSGPALDQHQMIDDLFRLSKGMGRTKPLRTYKGVQLESHTLIAVQQKLDEYYQAETEAIEENDRLKINTLYVDQLSMDAAADKGQTLKKVIEESHNVGDWIHQKQSDFDYYGKVTELLKNGSAKAFVVRVEGSRIEKPKQTSLRGWYPEPRRIKETDIPPKALAKLKTKLD